MSAKTDIQTATLPGVTPAHIPPDCFRPAVWLVWCLFWFLLTSGPLSAAESPPLARHELTVKLLPERHRLEVTDRITLPAAARTVEFLLHDGLEVSLTGTRGELDEREMIKGPVTGRVHRVRFQRPVRVFQLRYRGRIHHPLSSADGRRGSTPGDISSNGVFLAASSLWYPQLPGHFVTFSMQLSLPDGWSGISQGKALQQGSGWQEESPQDEIYLIAARFRRYSQQTPHATAEVWLRNPDDALAARYLAATETYLDLYSDLLGPYPYKKFALVENSWESGYGMPSFTLLGPRVIRLPFILHSSYPHEILHNWWGNGVYVDYARGNWSEGLTSYLADHLLQERQGKGATYRRDTLQRFASYVREEHDFPLIEFRGRHGEASQAIGYGRMLMLIHMLRMRLGDKALLAGMRRFYRDNLFRIAGFDDLRQALETASGQDLSALFRQWTQRTGAPRLQLKGVSSHKEGDGYLISGTLRQTQKEAPFQLQVPVYIQTEGGTRRLQIALNQRSRQLSIHTRERPLQLRIDPLFDLFRRLSPGETPSSVGDLFGADRLTIILPGRATQSMRKAYRQLASRLQQGRPNIRILQDDRLASLPAKGSYWLFGRENRFTPGFLKQLPQGTRLDTDSLLIEGRNHPLSGHSLVLTRRRSGQPATSIGLLLLGDTNAAQPLAAKLPHYGKYSFLLFYGERAGNRLKGQWQTVASDLSADLTEGEALPSWRIPDHLPLSAPSP